MRDSHTPGKKPLSSGEQTIREGLPLKERPLEVVTTCRARDLPTLEIAAQKLFENIRVKSLYVIVPGADRSKFQSALGRDAIVLSEDEIIPGMTRAELRRFPGPQFPQAAGWYFQQFVKLQVAFQSPHDDYYLIWDADTIPLRPLQFFDDKNRMLLTKSAEFHTPYFDTYERILRESPNREYSFIAQHMIVQKSVAREMLSRIQWWTSAEIQWPWKVLSSLPRTGNYCANLFSEYETYGHYIKNHYLDRVRIIDRSWMRDGSKYTNGWIPTPSQMQRLSQQYDFVAFERANDNWLSLGKAKLKQLLKSRSWPPASRLAPERSFTECTKPESLKACSCKVPRRGNSVEHLEKQRRLQT
jgi:hypothetical protein